MASSSSLESADTDTSPVVLTTGSAVSSSSSTASATPSSTLITVSRDLSGKVTITAGADTFIWFPKLPFELRVKVWKYMFTGQVKVSIEQLCYRLSNPDMSNACDDLKNALTNNKIQPLSVAFFATAESRMEAEKNHTLIVRSSSADLADPTKAPSYHPVYYFHPSDVFCIEFLSMMYSAGAIYDWISEMKAINPVLINKVTKLEVRGVFTQVFFITLFNDNRTAGFKAGEFRLMYCGSLTLFPALKEITFTGKEGDKDWDNMLGKATLMGFQLWISRFLQAARSAFTLNNSEAPTVIFRSFKQSLEE